MDNASKKRMDFKNDNGMDYFIIAGDEREAFLRNMNTGGYVIARGLRWKDGYWDGGSYFGEDEFEIAAKVYMRGGGCNENNRF